jgi:hypothetical protein
VRTLNGKLAVTPFPNMAVKTEAKGTGTIKVGYVETKVALVALTVVFPGGENHGGGYYEFSEGDTVYIRGSHFTAPWAKEIHSSGGKEFILVPISALECHDALGMVPQNVTVTTTTQTGVGTEYRSSVPNLNDLF